MITIQFYFRNGDKECYCHPTTFPAVPAQNHAIELETFLPDDVSLKDLYLGLNEVLMPDKYTWTLDEELGLFLLIELKIAKSLN